MQEIVDTAVWIMSRLLHRFFQLLTRNTTFNIVLELDSKSLSSTLEMFSMHDRRSSLFTIHNTRAFIQATSLMTRSQALLLQTLLHLFESPLSTL